VDHSSGQPRWRAHPIWLGVVLVVALLAALALAPPQARTRTDATTQALIGWLWPTRWIWPLAAALTLAVLSIPAAPHHRRRLTRTHPGQPAGSRSPLLCRVADCRTVATSTRVSSTLVPDPILTTAWGELFAGAYRTAFGACDASGRVLPLARQRLSRRSKLTAIPMSLALVLGGW
jgi:hypothetical protein